MRTYFHKALSLIAILLASPAVAADVNIVGEAGVTDGDTIRIGGTRIRLSGIDAPETHQTCSRPDGTPWPCGAEAARQLQHLVANRTVTCHSSSLDRYGRSLATCYVNKLDIGKAMVRSGWAVAYTRYSTQYVADEAMAKKKRLGIWQGDFTMPWDWRKENK